MGRSNGKPKAAGSQRRTVLKGKHEVCERGRRPMNCFLVWARETRSLIAVENPTLHNTQISQILGETWRTMSDESKRPYVEKAALIKQQYELLHPPANGRRMGYAHRSGSTPTAGDEGLKPVVMSLTSADDHRSRTEPIFARPEGAYTVNRVSRRPVLTEHRFSIDPEIAAMIRMYLTGFVVSDDEFDKYLAGDADPLHIPSLAAPTKPSTAPSLQKTLPVVLTPRVKNSFVTYIKLESP